MASQARRITEHSQEYRRDVGTVGVVFLVVNGLIGSGIFALPEVLHRAVGTFAPWLMLLGAMLMASVFFCFASLARLTDRSGGPQRFVTDAFGRFPGFQVGWLFYFGRMVAHAANVTVLVSYAAAFWPVLGVGLARSCAIVVIIGVVTVLNVVGMKRAVSVLGALTLFKLAPLVLLAGLVLVANPSMEPVALPQFTAVQGVALAALYAFIGCENATIAAGETKNPIRSVPRALLISLAIVGMVYFGLQFAYSNSPVAGTGSETPLAALAGHYAGDVGALLIGATVIVSVLGNSVAGHTVASRITAALSEDRLIPQWFGHVSRWRTPANSIVFFGLGALLFALTGTFVALAISATLARLLGYIASIGALPRLRILAGLEAFTLRLGAAAGVALSLCIWAAFQSSREQWTLIAAFLSAGTVLFFIARYSPTAAPDVET
ncbi:APC family permease [Sphingomonas sediminicola]|uniref:APC family permease n=1 Tax=Sphingomonas sediminicola TaxID=386874 RepID=UPI001CA6FCC8